MTKYLVLCLLFVVTGCGTMAEPSDIIWHVQYSDGDARSRGEPRFQIIDSYAWVGPREDKYGVEQSGGYQEVLMNRHCGGKWSVTYTDHTKHLPAADTDLILWVTSRKGTYVDLDNVYTRTPGIMLSNNVTAVFQKSPDVDRLMFTNGEAQIVVTTTDEVVISVSNMDIFSKPPNWFPFSSSIRLPDDIAKICGEYFDDNPLSSSTEYSTTRLPRGPSPTNTTMP